MLAQLVTRLGDALRKTAAIAGEYALALWRLVRRPLIVAFQVIAALLLLFEEWGWRPLVALLAALSRFRAVARLELLIAGLPPYGALAALAVPTSVLFPLKFVALYLLAQGYAASGGALFVGAKIASTALIARIFLLTKPSLMRIGWFARAYDWIVPWQEAMFAAIRASWAWRYGRMLKNRVRVVLKTRLWQEVKKVWARAKPRLDEASVRWRAWRAETWAQARPLLKHAALRLRLALRRALAHVRGV
jgi:hypothetical protein